MEQSDLNQLKNLFQERNKEIKKERDQVLSKIGEFLEQNGKSNNTQEQKDRKEQALINLGKFINLHNPKIEIEQAFRDSDDFVINLKNNSIQVKITELDLEPSINLDAAFLNNLLQTETAGENNSPSWLVISVNKSQENNAEKLLNLETLKTVYQTTFNKVFVADFYSSKLLELKVS